MNEIDRELEAAWRAASREEPSTTLDQSIRAAARREVGAAPRRGGPRPMRAWWPLAAAATVAALAIGIVQLIPPERVSPEIAADVRSKAAADKVAANEVSSPAQAAAQAESDDNPRTAAHSDEPSKLRGAALQARKEKPALPAAEEQLAARTRDRANAGQNVAAQRAPAQPIEREKKQKSEVAPATVPAPPSDAASSAGMSRSVPFPASLPREKLAEQVPPAAAPSPPATAAAGALASNAEPTPERRMAMAKTAEAYRDENAAGRPVDEWIKQIRRLIAEGKRDEAGKELTAFRALYKERADSLLPTDLRQFKR